MATIKKSKKKKIIIPIILVLIIAIVSGGLVIRAQYKKTPEVSLYTIGRGNIYETVDSTGKISSGTSKEYKVGASATVKEVFVKVGDKVKQGDMLATFDTTTLDSEVKNLTDTYNQSKESYQTSIEEQKTAKEYLEKINPQIEELEKKVEQLNAKDGTQSGSSSSNSGSSSKNGRNDLDMNSLLDALSDLVEQLNNVNASLDVISVALEVVADAIPNGDFSGEIIGQQIGEAIADAITDPETLAAIEGAVANVDWEAIGEGIANTENVALASAETRLAALYAQKEVFSVRADGDIVNAKKEVMNSSKMALDVLKATQSELQAGWTAAFDGTITACDIYPGEQTSMITSGMKLENMDTMIVTLSLNEYDVHKTKVGMDCTIKTAYGSYTGKVLTIAPTATGGESSSILNSVGSMAGISGLSSLTETGSGVQCTVSVDKPDSNIIVGFDANVEIEVGDNINTIEVPIESLVLDKTGSYVYVYNAEEGTVTKTKIETGAISDSAYQVLSGLEEGDVIIATPSSDYTEETFEVRVKK